MRVVLTGAGGQLGQELVKVFDVPHTRLAALGRDRLDITDRDQVLAALGELRADIVVNAATFTAVDACEAEPDRAFAVNALGVRHLAEACRRFGGHLVQISTDYVFDGGSSRAYHEWDRPNPQSVYARSKLAGEHEAGAGATIIRTSWLNGGAGSNFVKTMIRLAGEREHLRVVDDQRGSPTFTADLAPVVRKLAIDRRPGVVHVTNQGEATWFELARETLRLTGHDPGKVEPTSTQAYGAVAPRPAYSVLDNAVLRLERLPLLPAWQDGLRRMIADLPGGEGTR